jgi:cation diffusion facilitator CzcD-associated flavoprotein CzcO
VVPNGDLFKAIGNGTASVVTDHIETFTETGIRLKSGKDLRADIIVTATGLNMAIMGETAFSVDGAPVDFGRTWTYKGMMFSGVPNLVSTFGYINASWTLRADLTCEYVCRLVNHLDKLGATQVTPRLRDSDRGMPERPWIDDFSAGYMQREMHRFPRQGDREPWVNPQDYKRDKRMIRHGAIEDGALAFEKAHAVARSQPVLQAAE